MSKGAIGRSSVPNVLTALNITLGVTAILLALHAAGNGHAARSFFVAAAWLVVAATVVDGLDGTVARRLGTTGPLGAQLDSLADLTVFGVAPGVLIYARFLVPFSPWTAAVPVLFALAGAFRLARFNADDSGAKHTHFEGLPTTSSGGALGAYLLSVDHVLAIGVGEGSQQWFVLGAAVLALAHAVLMASTIEFAPFSRFFFRGFGRAGRIAVCVVLLLLLARWPAFTLLGLALLYDTESVGRWGGRRVLRVEGRGSRA